MPQEWYSPQWFSLAQLKDFSWANSYLLYCIGLIPLVFWLRGVFHDPSRQWLTLSFGNQYSVRTWSAWLRWLYPAAVFVALSCCILALARPQVVTELKDTDAEVIDIVLALDVSESMTAQDLQPTRLAAAKNMAQAFVSRRLQDRIGLVAFAGEAFTLCPLTDDHELLSELLKTMQYGMIKTAGTAIGSAVAVGINRLRESTIKSKVMILMSDGSNTAGNLDPITTAKLARAFNIKIYTIVVGLAEDKTTNNATDESVLQQIASITQGRFFRADKNTTLQKVFAEINQLERVKVKVRSVQDVQDFYRVYLYWSIVFWLFALLLKASFVANVLED